MAYGWRLKPRQQRHETRLRGLRSQSAWADFASLLPRLQSPGTATEAIRLVPGSMHAISPLVFLLILSVISAVVVTLVLLFRDKDERRDIMHRLRH